MGCCYWNKKDDDPEIEEVHETIKRNKGDFKGPLREGRRIRDVHMLIVFLLFIGGLGVVAWRSFHTGDPRRIAYGYDSFGNICGVDNRGISVNNAEGNENVGLDMRNFRYLYFLDQPVKGLAICVESCPDVSADCDPDNTPCKDAGVCFSSGPYNETTIPNGANECPDRVVESVTPKGVLRRCNLREVSPRSFGETGTQVAADFISFLNSFRLIEQVFEDVITGYRMFAYAIIVSLAVCLVVIFLMRCFVRVLVYGLILLGLLGTLALSIVTYLEWRSLKDSLNDLEPEERLRNDVRNEKLLFGFMIFLFVFTGILWLIALAMRNRIRLSVVLLQQASRAVVRMPWLYISPIFTNIFVVAFIAFWLATYAYMTTSGDGRLIQGRIQYDDPTHYQYMWWYNLFGLFWVTQFILACEEVTIAGAVATWYFTRKGEVLISPFWGSVWRTIRYHLGSVAMGSLIIALVKLIRFIFEYINHKLENNKGPIVDYLMKCFRCCLWCLEKFLRFINKNAYIEIAIYGYSFCTAARQAFKTLVENAIRVAVLNLVSSFVLFICKLFVVAIVGILAYYWITVWNTSFQEDLNYFGAVVLVCCVIAYIIADQFLAIYDMAVDTIFLCFAEDEKRNNGKDRPYYMDASLRQFLQNNSD